MMHIKLDVTFQNVFCDDSNESSSQWVGVSALQCLGAGWSTALTVSYISDGQRSHPPVTVSCGVSLPTPCCKLSRA